MRTIKPATVLIVLIFGAASVLAWQAYVSARSHRQSAERVLNDYVQFAAWEFVRLSQGSLKDAILQWSEPICREGGVLMTPAEFNARPECRCRELHAVTIFRRFAVYERDRMDPVDPTVGPEQYFDPKAMAKFPKQIRYHLWRNEIHGSGPSKNLCIRGTEQEKKVREEARQWIGGA